MKPVLTLDGSFTLFDEKSGEHYHSIRGALTESQHVFIQAGLQYLSEIFKEIHIIEMGFGTGLNALLSLQFAQSNPIKVYYSTIELYPLSGTLITEMQIPNSIGMPELAEIFEEMHCCAPNIQIRLSEHFTFIKYFTDIRQFQNTFPADLVYYDAFSPNVQAALWTTALFEKLNHMMLPGGVLVTYCAKGQVKRNLKSAGFNVETLPGAAGKREMIRARKLG